MPPTIPLTPDTLFAQGTVTLAGLAKEFGISRTAAYRLMNAGRLPYTQIGEGGNRLIPRAAVVKLLAEGLVGFEVTCTAGA